MKWEVHFYQYTNGNEPVKDFILGQPSKAIAEIIHVFDLLYRFNINLGLPYVRKITKSSIRELRIKHGSDYYRILFFLCTGRKFILLHAILKKEGRIRNSDIEIAENRMNDYLSRCLH